MIENKKTSGLPTVSNMLRILESGFQLGPLTITATRYEGSAAEAPTGGDAPIEVAWGSRRYPFLANIKARSTPRVFKEALGRTAEETIVPDRLSMIVLPYLSTSALDELDSLQQSGIDLSGNGLIIVPGKLYVYRSGQPNRYRESLPTKYAYRGTTGLVPRVFLCRPRYEQVSQIQAEIAARGARVVLPTVSKALKRMEEDALISRRGNTIRLLQADALLDKLRASYQPPRITARCTFALDGTLGNLFAPLADAFPAASTVLSGASSVARYAVMGRTDRTVVYCRDCNKVARFWEPFARETSRFADLELRETGDATVYFDARQENGLRYASPVQTYLELATGDGREQQAAQQVRDQILKEVSTWTPS